MTDGSASETSHSEVLGGLCLVRLVWSKLHARHYTGIRSYEIHGVPARLTTQELACERHVQPTVKVVFAQNFPRLRCRLPPAILGALLHHEAELALKMMADWIASAKDVFFVIGSVAGIAALFRPVVESKRSIKFEVHS